MGDNAQRLGREVCVYARGECVLLLLLLPPLLLLHCCCIVMRAVLTVFAWCVLMRPLLAQECLTAGHVAAEATVTYMQSCCIGDALLIQSTFVGVNGATIDDFVDLYVTIDNGSLPVWPTSTYLIANGMRFEYWNDSFYYYIQYTPGSVAAANYADQPGASMFSLGIDHPSGQPTGDHAAQAGCSWSRRTPSCKKPVTAMTRSTVMNTQSSRCQ